MRAGGWCTAYFVGTSHDMVYRMACWCTAWPASVLHCLLVNCMACWCTSWPQGVLKDLLVCCLACWCDAWPVSVLHGLPAWRMLHQCLTWPATNMCLNGPPRPGVLPSQMITMQYMGEEERRHTIGSDLSTWVMLILSMWAAKEAPGLVAQSVGAAKRVPLA